MKQPTQHVAFREKPEIVKQIDVIVEELGTDRSAWVRAAVREKLERCK